MVNGVLRLGPNRQIFLGVVLPRFSFPANAQLSTYTDVHLGIIALVKLVVCVCNEQGLPVEF
jgi:hypothetical protein